MAWGMRRAGSQVSGGVAGRTGPGSLKRLRDPEQDSLDDSRDAVHTNTAGGKHESCSSAPHSPRVRNEAVFP